jgi:hypothetical protein
MKYHCCDPRRLEVLKRSGKANAIEFIEVLDRGAPPGAPRQQTLLVRMLHPLRPDFDIAPDQIRIDGGERIRSVGVEWCAPADALPPNAEAGLDETVDDPSRTLVVRTDGHGDFSTYTLTLISGIGSDNAPDGYDPRLSAIAFSFKVECPTDHDCAQAVVCPPPLGDAPTIDYLAKDYQGFRRLMIDRLSLLTPGWTERSAADLGMVLVELLAFAADNLSYRQDAIATEAYLATARKRISVRRHARLVDYLLHEGCNARAFVHFNVSGHDIDLPRNTQLLTRTAGLPTEIKPEDVSDALIAGAQVFESAHGARLDEDLNELTFYTWGDEQCCLPKGATRATVRGHLTRLKVGDCILLEEIRATAAPGAPVLADVEEGANRAHRWIVRLTDVAFSTDPSGQLFDEPPVDAPIDVTEIAWDVADALPFPLCISVAERPGEPIAVARGNIVLVDHGRTLSVEDLGEVPRSTLSFVEPAAVAVCGMPVPKPVPPRFAPALADRPLTHGFALEELLGVPIRADSEWWPASALLTIEPRYAMPQIEVSVAGSTERWDVQRDLLGSGAAASDFTIEIDDDGRANLRFGDGVNGKRPDPGASFRAVYRVGNGVIGNVGAEAITHIVHASAGLFTAVRNPMSASGGVDPEDIEVARRDAPQAFRTQERAVTEADYAAAAERRPDVHRAAANMRWTGSWYSVFVIPDRLGGAAVDTAFSHRMRNHLERFRMAGYDLAVRDPRYIPLDVRLHICVRSDHFRTVVLRAVEEVLSSRLLADGRTGIFHADAFSFGQPVYLSRIVAAAQAVEGVEAVWPERFQRMANPDPGALDDGIIPIGALEIAQLANNPNFPERGRLVLSAGGGK